MEYWSKLSIFCRYPAYGSPKYILKLTWQGLADISHFGDNFAGTNDIDMNIGGICHKALFHTGLLDAVLGVGGTLYFLAVLMSNHKNFSQSPAQIH